MKRLSDYRTMMLIMLGDASGRRYSEETLDMGLRQALSQLSRYVPHRETITVKISTVSGREARLNGWPGPGASVLSVRDASGKLLDGSVYDNGVNAVVMFYGHDPMPGPGDRLQLELGLPQRIRDLDDSEITTVPDELAATLAGGAAGYAIRMRAHSVTEVFGKRPEDTERLEDQSVQLINDFMNALSDRAFADSLHKSPWPGHGFPI